MGGVWNVSGVAALESLMCTNKNVTCCNCLFCLAEEILFFLKKNYPVVTNYMNCIKMVVPIVLIY